MINSKYTTLTILLSLLFSTTIVGQNFTNSPYTRYGLGELDAQTSVKSRAMGGVSYAIRDNMQVNFTNPASYSCADSLSFIFEGGVSFQNSNFSNGSIKKNAKNASFDYIAMQFRLAPWLGFSAGVIPLSHVGYMMGKVITNEQNPDNNATVTYSGSGGLNQFYGGLSFRPIKSLSVGVNASYLFGSVSHTMSESFESNTSAFPFSREATLKAKGMKFDIGAQYTQQINKDNKLTLGVVFSPKHAELNTTGTIVDVKGNTTTGIVSSSTTELSKEEATAGIPTSLGVGVAYEWKNKLTVAMDFMTQKWSDITYMNNKEAFCDRTKIAFGAEYLPSPFARNYLGAIKYRIGAYYSLPYYKKNNIRAAKEYGITAGFSLPLPRTNSKINITGQYVCMKGADKTFLDERVLRLCIGVTYNDHWFFKRKVN